MNKENKNIEEVDISQQICNDCHSKSYEKERIICSAIHNPEDVDIVGEPLIYCSLRHHNILWQSEKISRNPHHQGFLTSKGRFVNRKEGLKIALENDQIIDHSQIRGDALYSEDLY